jgi:hypothetical protein
MRKAKAAENNTRELGENIKYDSYLGDLASRQHIAT